VFFIRQRVYPAECLLGTAIQQVGHTPTPVKAQFGRRSILASRLIRIWLARGGSRMISAHTSRSMISMR
jgi:hypothetical protein